MPGNFARWQVSAAFAAVCAWAVIGGGAARAATVEEAIDIRTGTNAAAAESQQKIEEISDDTEKMAAEYRSAIKETHALQIYNQQVQDLLVAQEAEIESLRAQIDGVTGVGRQITPLMLRMIDTLDTFVSLDLPFLPDERRERIKGLHSLMLRADVTLSEKYRRVLEAYQIENEYGRTIEAYRGSLDAGGKSRTVDFLRIGRVALLYETLDGAEVGAWDPKRKEWIVLGGEYRGAIHEGLRMARKQVAPDLLTVPVTVAEVVK
jgi:hypothetical protein